MESKIEKKAGLGVFLWIILAVYIFSSAGRLLSLLFPVTFASIYAGGPSWGYIYNLFAFIIEASGIVGIILRKKWGIYFMVFAYLSEVFIDFFYFTPKPSIGEWLPNLIIVILLIWAVKRKWEFFK
jgi:hypothetical protein